MDRLNQFGKSLKYALRGLKYAVAHEKNFQNQIAVSVLVIGSMFYFQVTRSEAIVLFLVILGVLVMELLNTVMERIVDILRPKVHPYARLIKDLMAASVLVSSIFALIIGFLIFFPYFFP